MSKIYIYTLSDDTGIRYVGQTINPKLRLSYHKAQAKKDKTRKGLWLKQLLDSDKQPTMSVIDEVEEDKVNSRESYLMWYYASLGCDMLNSELTGITQDFAIRQVMLLNALDSGDFGKWPENG